MAPPVRLKSYEESSAAAQRAVHIAGGADAVVDRIFGAFPCRADAGRLVGLRETLASARSELEALDLAERRSPVAVSLRQTISSTVAETVALTGRIETERKSAARACLMSAVAGDQASLAMLATQAEKVSPAFHAAIIEANT